VKNGWAEQGGDVADRDPRTYAIIGAAMEVHRELGAGFLEAVYHEALALEMTRRDIPHQREVELPVVYKGQRLATAYRADFVCYDDVILELKALTALSGVEKAQIINYLKATGLKTGLLVDFGAPSLQYKRFIHSQPQSILSERSQYSESSA
jgi:GxxExxY protein